MRLTVQGAGPPVVLTHGFADDAATFDRLVPALTRHRLARWDLPGHGSSGVAPQPSSRGAALAWLDGAIVAAGPGPTVHIRHHLGGSFSPLRTDLDPNGIPAIGRTGARENG